MRTVCLAFFAVLCGVSLAVPFDLNKAARENSAFVVDALMGFAGTSSTPHEQAVGEKQHRAFQAQSVRQGGLVHMTDIALDKYDHKEAIAAVRRGGFTLRTVGNDHDHNHHGHDDDSEDANRVNANIFRQQRAKALLDIANVFAVWNTSVYPQSMDYASGLKSIDPWVMFPISFGRIHPVGYFTTAAKSAEYFLLAAPLPNAPMVSQVRVDRVSFVEVTANGIDRVWVKILLELSLPAAGLYFNHTHTGFVVTNPNSTICAYEVAFRRLELRDPAPETQSDAVLNTRINTLCTNIMHAYTWVTTDNFTCPLTNPATDFYTSFEDCVAFHQNPAVKQRFGYQWVDQQSLKCHEFHYGLVTQSFVRAWFAPTAALSADRCDHFNLHLQHVGPVGGGKCATHPFDTFQNDQFVCQAQI